MQVEKRVHDRVVCLGEVFDIEAVVLHPAENNHHEENYVVSFQGEITVRAEAQVEAENQAHDRLSFFGQITEAASKNRKNRE